MEPSIHDIGADAMYYYGAVNILCFLFKICAYLMKIYHLQYQELGNQKVTENMFVYCTSIHHDQFLKQSTEMHFVE